MIKKLLFIVPVFLSLTLHLWAQGSTLVMVHPTEYNLNLFTHLVSHEIIVVDDLKILGVYHAQEAYD